MKSNAETSNKKSKGYGMKIAMAAGLGTLLVCGIVAIGLIAFSDLFSIKPVASPSREYNYNDPYSGLKPYKNNSKEKSLKVQYLEMFCMPEDRRFRTASRLYLNVKTEVLKELPIMRVLYLMTASGLRKEPIQ